MKRKIKKQTKKKHEEKNWRLENSKIREIKLEKLKKKTFKTHRDKNFHYGMIIMVIILENAT